MVGIKHVKGGDLSQKLPITPHILFGIYNKLNLHHSFDATFWAICLTAFYGLFRKSHLLPMSQAQFEPSKQFTFQDFSFFTWGIIIMVRWSKTIQFRERVVHIPLPRIPGSPLCPHKAITHAFAFVKCAPKFQHAFSWLGHKSLLIHRFIYRAFLDKFKSCVHSLGYNPSEYAGHSFCRGGASYAFRAGIPIELIKMMGDWKSNSVLLYLTVPLSICLHSTNLVSKHILTNNFT